MGIKNHNTKREKNVMIKRLRIAVFIAVSLGIVLIVFRYFGFVSKTIYELTGTIRWQQGKPDTLDYRKILKMRSGREMM